MASGESASLHPAGASDRLRTSVLALFAGAFLVLASVVALGALLYRHELLADGQRRAETLAFVLGDHFVRTISAIDTTLNQLSVHGVRAGAPSAANTNWPALIEAARAGLAGVSAIVVIDETGIIRQATVPILIGQSRADFFLFRRLSGDPNAGFLADVPFRGQQTGQWVIPFGRRLTGPDGKFAGIIVATLEPSRLRAFYQTIDVGRTGFISVLHPEKAVLFRVPSPTDSMGESAQDNPLLAHWKEASSSGFLRAPFNPRGPEYLNAYRILQDPHLLVAVSLAESEILATWWLGAAVSAAIVAGFGILLLLAWGVIMREIHARAEASQQVVAQAKELAIAMARRDEADAALRKNQAQFQSIMHQAPMMVSLKDREGRYTFVNEAFQKFTGRGGDVVVGKTAADLNAKEFADFIAAEDRAAMESRRAIQREVISPPEHGSRTTLLMKFPVFDERNEVTGVGTVMTDITEQKQAQLQLAQAQRIESLGQLTGGIAHDFNNLLTSILLNADVLASLLDDKLRPLAEAVRLAAERGADLTRRLLAFGRRQMLEPRPTSVTQLLAGMEPLMRRTLGEHIEIALRHDADPWSATVDPGQLENAVLNLAVNARDAMPSGGKLTIETTNVELGADQTADNPEIKPGQYVMVAVTDTGTGMPPDVVARAFEPFFTTKDVGKGTGLGLSMVYGFVKQSGGGVRMHSEVGRGTVVRLYLPRSMTESAATEAAPAAPQALPRGQETILFVEDDAMVRKHTGAQIVNLGYQVVSADNAAEAIALVENGCTPDLLFTDVVMPGGMNGRQLALKLRERWPKLRVLYTSGYAHGRLTIDGESVPTKYVLGKPYRRADLAAKLREVLDEPATAAK
jgi:PAS domain S-box-containing protein